MLHIKRDEVLFWQQAAQCGHKQEENSCGAASWNAPLISSMSHSPEYLWGMVGYFHQ